jgi:hypothetical protein
MLCTIERRPARSARRRPTATSWSIQEAFKIGLILSTIRSMVEPTIIDRIDEATTQLDELIRILRAGTFGRNHTGS